MLAIAGRIVESQQTLFQRGARDVQVGSVRPDGDRFSIGINRRRIVFQAALHARQRHRPAVVARRLLDGLRIEIQQLLLALILLHIESRFRRKRFVFRIVVD